MKQALSKNDKISIIKGLKADIFPIYELNHLSSHILDHTRAIELIDEYSVPITMTDKRELLKALQKGYIDFDKMPDLKNEIETPAFMQILKAVATKEEQE